jgi:hypothetical protein
MCVELEKNIGPRVPQAFLRCLERDTCLHHLCRSPVPQDNRPMHSLTTDEYDECLLAVRADWAEWWHIGLCSIAGRKAGHGNDRAWKSLRDSHIPTASTTGYMSSRALNSKHRRRKGLVTDVSGPQRNACPGTLTPLSVFGCCRCRRLLRHQGRRCGQERGCYETRSIHSEPPNCSLPRSMEVDSGRRIAPTACPRSRAALAMADPMYPLAPAISILTFSLAGMSSIS